MTPVTLSCQLKVALEDYKVSIENFSTFILKSDAATLIEILNAPKQCWSECSQLTIDHFKLIYLWLIDKNRLNKLKNFDERKQHLAMNASDTIMNENNEDYQVNSNSHHNGSIILSHDQLDHLTEFYENYIIPFSVELDNRIESISRQLNLSIGTVAAWLNAKLNSDNNK